MVNRFAHPKPFLPTAVLLVSTLLSFGPLHAQRGSLEPPASATVVSELECALCGGPDNLGCAEGEFCKRFQGYCQPDSYGYCTHVPWACPAYMQPVCGCDGLTYENPCYAEAAAVSIAHYGSCESSCSVGTDSCSAWSYCQTPDGCIATSGVCTPSLSMCEETCDPVCGCDGRTYCNRCLAAQARVSIGHTGACDDACPADPQKTDPGACGCGIPDDDIDSDGMPDCLDVCPADPASHVAGIVNPEFQVNETWPCMPGGPEVAVADDGRAVVVWGRGDGIAVRRFTASGVPDGGELQVAVVGSFPGVAMAADGSFVVVWSEFDASWDEEIVALRYDSQGIPVGVPFTVNQTSAGQQAESRVAMDALGNFVVLWRSEDPVTEVGNLVARRFAADGSALGDEIAVTEGGVSWHYPALAIAPAGSFAVVAYAYEPTIEDRGIYVRLYDEDGVAQGPPFSALSYPATYAPSVALDGTGNVIVAAQVREGDQWNIQARRFAPDGSPMGPEFRINTRTGYQVRVALAADTAGDFIALWIGAEPDHSGQQNVYGRRYDSNGLPLGDAFRVRVLGTGSQGSPEVASNSTGAFVAAWASYWPRDDRWGVFGTRGHIVGDADHDGVWDCNGPCEMVSPDVCCAPSDGTPTPIDDGNPCTADTCQPDGTVTRDNLGPPNTGDGLRLDRGDAGGLIEWTMPEGAIASNLYRGTIEPGTPWAHDGDCLESGLIHPWFVDSESPAAGQLFHYRVTAVDETCEGPVDTDSEGQPRFVAFPCVAR